MSIRTDWDADRDILIFTVEGVIDPAAVIESLNEQFGRHPARFSIWNLRQAALFNLDFGALREVAVSAARHIPYRDRPETIFVVAKRGDADLLRLYGELSDLYGNTTTCHFVSTLEEADRLVSDLSAELDVRQEAG